MCLKTKNDCLRFLKNQSTKCIAPARFVVVALIASYGINFVCKHFTANVSSGVKKSCLQKTLIKQQGFI